MTINIRVYIRQIFCAFHGKQMVKNKEEANSALAISCDLLLCGACEYIQHVDAHTEKETSHCTPTDP